MEVSTPLRIFTLPPLVIFPEVPERLEAMMLVSFPDVEEKSPEAIMLLEMLVVESSILKDFVLIVKPFLDAECSSNFVFNAEAMVMSSLAMRVMFPLLFSGLFCEFGSTSEVFKFEAMSVMEPLASTLPTISLFPTPD